MCKERLWELGWFRLEKRWLQIAFLSYLLGSVEDTDSEWLEVCSKRTGCNVHKSQRGKYQP